jgi:hypothetical protein
MAGQVPAAQLSLKHIFIARLDQLKAIASGLSELPQERLNELQSLLERAHQSVQE